MMSNDNAMELLLKLKDNGILVDLDGDKLKFKAPKGALTPSRKDELVAGKEALLDYLKSVRFVEKQTMIPHAPEQDRYPLSPAQFRMHVLSRFDGGNAAYNMPDIQAFNGDLDTSKLETAVGLLIERHESLRTCFEEAKETGEVFQKVIPANEVPSPFSVIDISNSSNIERDQARALSAITEHAFDLEKAPLVKVVLIKTAPKTHLLAFTMHHIISDGWSMGVLINEMTGIYGALVAGVEPQLDPLNIQYKDYCYWVNDRLKGQVFDDLKSYWMEKFEGELPSLNLPSEYSRPAVQSFTGKLVKEDLGMSTLEGLKRLATREGGTLYMSLLTAVNCMFNRLTGDEDIVLGSPVAGRDHPELENQIGFYANTLAYRNRFSAQETVQELFAKVKETTLGAFEHQLYPFDQLVEALDLKRDLSRSPIFDVIVSLQNLSIEGNQEQPETGLTASQFEVELNVSHFDLTFSFSEGAKGLELVVNYSDAIYSRQNVELFVRMLKSIMQEMGNDASLKIANIRCIDDLEIEKLTKEFNKETLDEPITLNTLDRIWKHAQQNPDGIAIYDEEKEITYQQLVEQASQFGTWLQERFEVASGDYVVVQLPTNIEFVVAVLGVWCAGAVYIPVDIEYPEERIAFILDDLNAHCHIDTKCLSEFKAKNHKKPQTSTPELAFEQLAYMIYTSGSTGKPKGVRVDHKNLAWMVQATLQTFGDEPAVMPLYASPAFDISLFEMLTPLTTGGTLHLIDKKQMFDGDRLVTMMSKLNRFYGVPTVLAEIFQFVDPSQRELAFGGLQQIHTGAERVPSSLLHLIRECAPNAMIIVQYGPTETTILCTTQKYTADIAPSQMKGEILGKPLVGCVIYILDAQQVPVPVGVKGEMYIGGDAVAQGYHQRPDLTAEGFLENPFVPGLMYKTGDFARWSDDGDIEFIGRADNQVKIKGHRIELGEVQTALSKVDKVNQAAVQVHKDDRENPYLVGYYNSSEEIPARELRKALEVEIPSYMVPQIMVFLDEFPVTPNGKIDHSKLPKPDLEADASDFVEPVGDIEKLLSEVWTSVLGMPKIGRFSNFYEIGGDSIKSIQVATRMRQHGFAVKVSDILRYAVLSELAGYVEPLVQEIDQSAIEGPVFLGPIQAGFLYAEHPESHHFNQSVLLFSKEPIDATAIQKSLDKLVEHHDALRMTFTMEESQWQQYNQGTGQLCKLEEHTLDKDQSIAEALEQIGSDIQSSINLSEGPLVKAALVQAEDGDRLIIVVHHLVVDGISWRIILEDLATLYGQFTMHQEPELPLKTDALQTWMSKLHSHANSEELLQQKTYWQEIEARGYDKIILDNPEGENGVDAVTSIEIKLDLDRTQLLKEKVNRAYTTEINDVLLSAVSLGFKNAFEQDRILVTLEGHGREELFDQVDITRTVGWFTSQFPLSIFVEDVANVGHHLVNVKEGLHNIPLKGVGYEILRYLADDEKVAELKFDLQPEVSFNYLGEFDLEFGEGEAAFQLSGEAHGDQMSSQMKREHLIDIIGIMIDGHLQLTLNYSDQQFEKETISKLSNSIKEALELVIDHCVEQELSLKTPVNFLAQNLKTEDVFALQQEAEIENIYPLSNLQQGLYFHYLKDSSFQAYFEQMAFRFQGDFHVETVRSSYKDLISRHAVLRTAFREIDGEILQVVYKNVSTQVSFEDLQNSSSQEQKKHIAQFREDDRIKYFDLAQPSVMRLSIFQLDAECYELVWSHHHILMDGWCLGILINEFFQLFDANHRGVELTLPKVKPYANYIEWLMHRKTDEGKAYWKSHLQGYNQAVGIPRSKQSASPDSYDHQVLEFQLGTQLSADVEALVRKKNVTGNILFQAAWAKLLSTYNQADDIVFGMVVSGRPAEVEGVENMVGLFINTIPVRIQWDAETTFAKLLTEMHELAVEREPHQYLQLAEIQSESEVGQELFDHILVYESFPVEANIDAANAEDSNDEQGEDDKVDTFIQTNYDFNVRIVPGEELAIVFTYNGARYENEIVEQVAENFQQLIAQIVEDSALTMKEYSTVSKQQKTELLVNSFGDDVPYPKDKTIIDLFRENVASRAEVPALKHGEKSYTYQELEFLSNKMAHRLQQENTVETGDVVAVVLPRSEWSVVAMLAAMKCGASSLTIDDKLPQQRIDFMIEDSAAKAVIDQNWINEFEEKENDFDGIFTTSPSQNDEAYIIYTSGTTGQPKGVVVGHRAVMDYVFGLKQNVDFSECQQYGLISTLSADLGYTVLFTSLALGGTLHLIPEEVSKDAHLMMEYQQKNQLDALKIVPSHWTALQTEEQLTVPNKVLLFGGEELKNHVITRLAESAPGDLQVFNHYGPTEATIGKLLKPIDWQSEQPQIDLGRPFSNTQILVLGNNQELLPVGAKGQLFIAGDGLASGYLNREELTNESFVSHPFDSNRKVYGTGDLARWTTSNTIEFFGRADQQVKIRGFRIELGEIEEALRAHSQIEEATALVKQDDAGNASLVTYYVGAVQIDADQLRSFCIEHLPTQMVPQRFIHLHKLPLTANGKIDRKALDRADVGVNNESEFVAPATKTEQLLAEIWQTVLKVDRVGINDDFFALGGDSIKSIQIASRLRSSGMAIKVSDVLKFTRLADQSKQVSLLTRHIEQSEVAGNVILGPIQNRFLNSEEPVKQQFNQSIILHSSERVEVQSLRNIIERLVAHHDALRMVFKLDEGQWIQENLPVNNTDSVIEVEIDSEQNLEEALKDAGEQLQSSLDLENGPLFKVGLFHCADGDRVLLVAHHLIVDGVSWRIILEDMATLFQAEVAGEKAELPLKTDSFKAWMSKLQEYANSEELGAELEYWKGIDEQTNVKLPVDFPDGENRIKDIENFSIQVKQETFEALKQKANKAYGTDVNDLLLTSFCLGLHDHFDIDNVAIYMEGHGREEVVEDIDVSRTVGWFTSRYPFVYQAAADDLGQSIIAIKEDLRTIPNKGIGYGVLRYLTNGETQWGSEPQISFNYLGDFDSQVGGEDSGLQMSSDPKGAENHQENSGGYTLSLIGISINGELSLTLNYSKNQYKEETIKGALKAIESRLESIVDHCLKQKHELKTPTDLTVSGVNMDVLLKLQENAVVEDIYPLSPLQKGIYFHAKRDSDIQAYFEQMNIRLKGIKDLAALRLSYAKLIERHAILRTAFKTVGNEIMQVVYGQKGEPLHYEDITHLSEADQDIYLDEFRAADRLRYFELENGNLMRMSLFLTAPNEFEFVWSHHHILMDGWCMSTIVTELFTAYDSYTRNEKPQLADVKPYAQYIEWLMSQDDAKAKDYWAHYLDGFETTSRIPKVPQTAPTGYEQKEARLVLSEQLTTRIQEITSEHKVTTNTVVQVLWATLLGRLNRTNDVAFGMVVSGRPAEISGVEQMVGLFINTVPVRIKMDQEMTFLDVLQQVQDNALESDDYHYMQLSDIQSAWGMQSELFDHIMIFENYPVEESLPGTEASEGDEEGIELKKLDVVEQTNYNFNIAVTPGDQLNVIFTYNALVHDAALVENMVTQLDFLANTLLTNPQTELHKVNLFTEQDRVTVFESFNSVQNVEAKDLTVLEAFAKNVQETPDAIAISYHENSWSYAQFDQMSTIVAKQLLVSHEISSESLIGIMLDRSEKMVVAMLAVLKTGAAYVPIMPDFPEARINYIKEDSGLKFVLDEALFDECFAADRNVDSIELPLRKADQLAYVMYTSGSTGQPKGVMIEDRNLTSFFGNMPAVFEMSQHDVIAATTNNTFDISNLEMLGALCFRMTIRMFSSDAVNDPFQLLSEIKASDVTVLQLTPSRLEQFLAIDDTFHNQFSVILVGGEALTQRQLEALSDSEAAAFNVYGPTETTIWSTALPLKGSTKLTIGKPLFEESIFILDDEGQQLPIGIPGEITIAGKGVGRGYWNRNELTDKCFVEHPAASNGNVYKTGDLGRWLPDGTIQFLGRIDDQVKIRGFRIEPGEIECQLSLHDAIKHSAVLVQQEGNNEAMLVAYYVADSEVAQEALQTHLLRVLPHYMLPTAFVKVDEIPLSSSGKVDRKALPKISLSESLSQKYVAPETETEQQLAEIWQTVLGQEKIGIETSYFEIGGNSIQAISIISRTLAAFEVEVPVKDFFENPTIRSTAEHIDNLKWLSVSDEPEADQTSDHDAESLII
jgi:amino acid adenylation domain-containing protein/non-ribosomal peptide synthase protein (TIGR01720 family)